MKYTIQLEPVYGKVRQDRIGVVLTLEENGQTMKFMPKYEDLAKIYMLLVEVEKINANLPGIDFSAITKN